MPFLPDLFANTPKLKRLSLCTFAYVSDAKKFIDACPSLEYLILREENVLDQTELATLDLVGCSKLRKYKNTYIVFATIFNDISALLNDQLNILKPLFTPYTTLDQPYLTCVVAQSKMFLSYALNFLVNEMHYDINGRYVSLF